MHEKNYINNNNTLQPFLEEARKAYKEQRVLGAQRALQFGGEQLMKHQMRMYNCTSSYVDRPAFFGEVFYILLCGAGAGFSVQKHHIKKLPKLNKLVTIDKLCIVSVNEKINKWKIIKTIKLSNEKN